MYLKALFNNVFTLNNLSVSCMSLHATSVFDKMYKINEALKKKKCTSKAPLSASKN